MALLQHTPFDTLWSSMSDGFPRFNDGSKGKYHLVEEDGGATLYVSAPGYKSDDLVIEMHEGRLSITGKPSVEHKSSGVIVPDQISLRFTVSPNYIVEGAELTDGVLAVQLNKARKTETLKIPVLSK